MSAPNTTDTRRDADIRAGKRHSRHRDQHKFKSCPNPPSVPSTVTETFQVTEDRTQLNFAPKVSWAAVTRDEQGHKIDLHQYVVQMVATSGGSVDANGMGPPVELEDGKPRLREMQKNIPKHDANGNSTDPADDYFIIWPEVPRPKSWYWQARVAAVDEKGCQGDWTPWTNQKLPWQSDSGRGAVPTPSGVTMIFDTIEKSRHDRYRAEVTFNEIRNWDIPGGDHQADVKGYVVELQAGRNTYPPGPSTTWDGPSRERTPEQGDQPTKTAVFEKVHKHYYYRARARTIDRFNRRSDWSDWVPNSAVGSTPSDTGKPPDPVNVDLNMNSHQARITWDEVIDPATNILHQDVAFFEVQLAKDSGYNNVVYKDTFCITQHKVFKLNKPKGDWYARVRAVDAAGNQSGWAAYPLWPSAKDTPRKPPPVPNVRVDFILQEAKKWDKVKARVRWDGVQELSDDISRYVVELESGDVVGGNPQDTYQKDGNRWTGHVAAPETVDDTGTEQSDGTQYGANQTDHPLQWMHPAKRGHWYRARVRAIDKDGQQGDWGPNPPDGWSGNGPHRQKCSPPNARVLKKPVNATNLKTVKGVGVKWDHPLDADGFPDETIDFFRVQVSTVAPDASTGFPLSTIMEDDTYVNARRALYATANWTNTAGPYYVAVQSVDQVGNTSDWSFQTDIGGTAVAISPDSTTLGPGDINDPGYFGGPLRPPTASTTLPTLPNAKYPIGSNVYLTADYTVGGKTFKGRRFYWNVDDTTAGWNAQVFLGEAQGTIDGGSQIAFRSLLADRIKAGEITANEMAATLIWSKDFILSGVGAFRTDTPPNARVEMSQVANQGGRDKISFINASGGSIAFQPFRDTASSGATRDNVDLVWFGTQTAGTGGSGLRWGGAANFRLVNNGSLQIGDPAKNAFPGGAGSADTGTVRLIWDTSTTPNSLRLVNASGKKATITVGNFV